MRLEPRIKHGSKPTMAQTLKFSTPNITVNIMVLDSRPTLANIETLQIPECDDIEQLLNKLTLDMENKKTCSGNVDDLEAALASLKITKVNIKKYGGRQVSDNESKLTEELYPSDENADGIQYRNLDDEDEYDNEDELIPRSPDHESRVQARSQPYPKKSYRLSIPSLHSGGGYIVSTRGSTTNSFTYDPNMVGLLPKPVEDSLDVEHSLQVEEEALESLENRDLLYVSKMLSHDGLAKKSMIDWLETQVNISEFNNSKSPMTEYDNACSSSDSGVGSMSPNSVTSPMSFTAPMTPMYDNWHHTSEFEKPESPEKNLVCHDIQEFFDNIVHPAIPCDNDVALNIPVDDFFSSHTEPDILLRNTPSPEPLMSTVLSAAPVENPEGRLNHFQTGNTSIFNTLKVDTTPCIATDFLESANNDRLSKQPIISIAVEDVDAEQIVPSVSSFVNSPAGTISPGTIVRSISETPVIFVQADPVPVQQSTIRAQHTRTHDLPIIRPAGRAIPETEMIISGVKRLKAMLCQRVLEFEYCKLCMPSALQTLLSKDENGHTCIMRLLSEPRSEDCLERLCAIIERLKKDKRIDILSATNKNNHSALYIASVEWADTPIVARYLVDSLVQLGVKPDHIIDSDGNSMLHILSSQGSSHAGVLAELLNARDPLTKQPVFSVGKQNNKAQSPLHIAALFHTKEMDCMATVKMLLQHGAKLTEQDDQLCTPLHLAVKGACDHRLVRVLTQDPQIKTAVNITDCSSNSALHLAAARNDVPVDRQAEVIWLLCNSGATHKHRNSEGRHPIALVAEERKRDIKKILQKKV